MIEPIKKKVRSEKYATLRLEVRGSNADVLVSQGRDEDETWITIAEEKVEEFITKLRKVASKAKLRKNDYFN